MNARHPIFGRNGGPRRFLERVITRDAQIPLSADDLEMENGWRCIPVPPTDDPAWFVVDDSRDYKNYLGPLARDRGPSMRISAHCAPKQLRWNGGDFIFGARPGGNA